MKKIIKLSVLALLLSMNIGCENDDQTTVQATGGPELLTPTDGSTYVLAIENAENDAMTLVWEQAEYDQETAANYAVEVAAAGSNFATVVDGLTGELVTAEAGLTSTASRFAVVSVDKLNDIAIAAGIAPFEAGDLQIRIKSWLGENNDLVQYSNPITITVTPYEFVPAEDPKLYLVGAPQAYYGVGAWTPENGMPMRYIGDGTTKVFEAYVKVATGEGFKFIGGLNWDTGNYGTIGGAQDGNLENSGGSGDVKVAETDGPGLYYVWVDIDNLEYKAVKMNWGIIGSATPGGWDNETPMTYDFATNTFTITTALSAGELKFRSANTGQFIASDAWKFNVGNSDPMVTYNPSAPNFQIAGGTYTLGLSLNLLGEATVTGL
ncbi:MAG TPA: SusE domain-containing protein [Flavobacterium sp.]|jgi:hypothetical protein